MDFSRHGILLTREVPRLRRVVADLLQALDATQQELELAVGGAGHVLGDLVAGQGDGDEGQAALGVGDALEAGAGGVELRGEEGVGRGRVLEDVGETLVVGDVEVVSEARLGLEALRAVPCHVLDRDQGAVGEEEEVQQAVADDGVVGSLDDGRQWAESGWERGVVVWEEVWTTSTNEVVCGRDVDLGLDVAPVEVIMRAAAEGRESHLVREVGAVIRQVVDVKARVDQ
jgi:hypothetical protein